MIVRETIFSWGETVQGETTAIRLQVLQKYNLLKENKHLNLFPAQNMFKLL